ncbi:MAG: division/cell wall cluster transcriptional repressor MraZ [Saprospiraceae bacterium]
MQRLTGEYECKVDAKGRLRMPSSLLRQLPSDNLTFTVNRGFEKHLILYPNEDWLKKAEEIDSRLNENISAEREVLRHFYGGATEVSLDGSNRILLPKTLVKYADITNSIMLFAMKRQIEIWSLDKYNEMISKEPVNFTQFVDEIFGKPVDKK